MSRHSLLKTVLSLFALIVFIGSANAHWSLDNAASTLSFVTVKAEHVAEVHTFDVLSGSIDDAGEVKIAIELASVNTMNPRLSALNPLKAKVCEISPSSISGDTASSISFILDCV